MKPCDTEKDGIALIAAGARAALVEALQVAETAISSRPFKIFPKFMRDMEQSCR
jgi:hypothetical protein